MKPGSCSILYTILSTMLYNFHTNNALSNSSTQMLPLQLPLDSTASPSEEKDAQSRHNTTTGRFNQHLALQSAIWNIYATHVNTAVTTGTPDKTDCATLCDLPVRLHVGVPRGSTGEQADVRGGLGEWQSPAHLWEAAMVRKVVEFCSIV